MGNTIWIKKLIKRYFKTHNEGSTEGIAEWINNQSTAHSNRRRRTTNNRTVANLLKSDPTYEKKDRNCYEDHGRPIYVTVWVLK